MSEYIIGDIHGCFEEFKKLLSNIGFNKNKDTLYITGDLVGKGDRPLDVLKLAEKYNARWVIGNHELYLLELYAKNLPLTNKFDQVILDSKVNYWIDYIKQQPFAIIENDLLLIHAGVHPIWSKKEIIKKSNIASELIKNDFSKINPNKFRNTEEQKKYKDNYLILDIFTYIRFVYFDISKQIHLDYNYKESLSSAPDDYYPWYKLFNEYHLLNGTLQDYKNTSIYFGHWSLLDEIKLTNNENSNIYCLDTGCVYGNKLTAINHKTKEIAQVDKIIK